jgi:hypothetical protein
MIFVDFYSKKAEKKKVVAITIAVAIYIKQLLTCVTC